MCMGITLVCMEKLTENPFGILHYSHSGARSPKKTESNYNSNGNSLFQAKHLLPCVELHCLASPAFQMTYDSLGVGCVSLSAQKVWKMVAANHLLPRLVKKDEK